MIRKFLNWKLFLVITLSLSIFLRFYQLGEVPAGLLNDEANKGYDIYSLLTTGKDQWDNFLPVTSLRGFGDYPPPFYHYLSIPSVFLFGLNAFAVRFASAFFGVLSVLLIYVLGKKVFNEKVGIFAAVSLAVFPWAIGLSRVAMEANIAISFLLISLIFGLDTSVKHKLRNLIISTIFLAVSFYTYSAYVLFAPIVFIAIMLFSFYKTKITLKQLAIPVLVFILIVFPLFLRKDSASVRFSQVGFTTNVNSTGLIDTLNMQRGQCIKTFPSSFCVVFENKAVVYGGALAKNYISHFSSNFLYTSGTVTQFSILEKRGLDYLFNCVFLLLGLFYLIKINANKKISIVLLALFAASPLADSLTGDGNYTRASMMIPFLALISGIGIYALFEFVKKVFKKRVYLAAAYIALFGIILISSTGFFISYLTYFKNNYSIYSQYGYEDLMGKVIENKDSYDKIYITRHLNDSKQYIYYLFYSKYDPTRYQSKKDVSSSQASDGWYSIDRIENIYFVQNPPVIREGSALSNEKILIISNPVDFAKEMRTKFVVKDKLGDVLFQAVELSEIMEYNRNQALLIP